MRFKHSSLPGVVIVEPDVHEDPRGYFLETYHEAKYAAAGITVRFVQDNQSRSLGGTIRGLHLQVGRPQGKLVRVVEGEIFDVAVDVRRGSPFFAQWVGTRLSAENFRQCYIPPGFAHGFAVISSAAQVEYKCTELYDPKTELGIAWNDPQIGIQWLVDHPILSERDRQNRPLMQVMDELPLVDASTADL